MGALISVTNVVALSRPPRMRAAVPRLGIWSNFVFKAISVMEKAKGTWCEAEVHRARRNRQMSPERDTAKAEASFERSLAVAGQQQAKSWKLRAAMSMAALGRSRKP